MPFGPGTYGPSLEGGVQEALDSVRGASSSGSPATPSTSGGSSASGVPLGGNDMLNSPSGLDLFMAAIRALESGGGDPRGDYTAVGPPTGKYGRARGAYQIMEKIWPGWAAEAGIPGADWRDPAAQDRVARYKMTQYFNKYGRWDAVAVAWFAGPGRVKDYLEGRADGVSDVTGTTVPKYVQIVNEHMQEFKDEYGEPGETVGAVGQRIAQKTANQSQQVFADIDQEIDPNFLGAGRGDLQGEVAPVDLDPRTALTYLMKQVSDLVAGGERIPYDEIPDARDEAEEAAEEGDRGGPDNSNDVEVV